MKIMAVDYGAARTGLAICDKTEFLASPIGVIYEKDFDKVIDEAAKAAKENNAEEIVVGLPLNMDGSKGEKAQLCEEFGQKLSEAVGIPVKMWDERQTTMQAAEYLNATNVRGKKRKAVIDQVAATIILESYMQYRKNTAQK